MYEGGRGGGIPPTVAGIAVLPNTGGNEILFVAALLSTVVGLAILTSTAVRFVATKAYKA